MLLTGPGGATLAMYLALMLMPLFILWGVVDFGSLDDDGANGPRDTRSDGSVGMGAGSAAPRAGSE